MTLLQTRSRAEVQYSTPALHDGPDLASMARRCFAETFARRYRSEDLDAFLATAYGPNGLLAELKDPEVDFRIARCDGQIIGYAKVAPLRAPAPDPQPGALELCQLYVLQPWHGTGVATALMEWALATARERRAPEIYLTVFENNHRAKRFYARHDFADVGECFFHVGSHVDEDRIWGRALVHDCRS